MLYVPIFAYFVLADDISKAQNESKIVCQSSNAAYSLALSWLDLFAKIIIPFSIMFASTIFLAKTLVSSRKRARVGSTSNEIQSTQQRRSLNHISAALNVNKKLKSREQRDFNFAMTSISLNILSLLLNLPITVFTIYELNVEPINTFLFMISSLCLNINLSYKFFLYLLVNMKFREEFFKIFSFCFLINLR